MGCHSVDCDVDGSTQRVNEGFDRLQDFLLAMHVGDEVRVTDAADASGLSPETCRAVLTGLEKAGLMRHISGELFARRALDFLGSV
jgi:DNA-binding IscR family transcriptional regulator